MKLYISRNDGGRFGESWRILEKEVASKEEAISYVLDINESEEEWNDDDMGQTFDEYIEAAKKASFVEVNPPDEDGGIIDMEESRVAFSFKSPEDASHRYFKYMMEQN